MNWRKWFHSEEVLFKKVSKSGFIFKTSGLIVVAGGGRGEGFIEVLCLLRFSRQRRYNLVPNRLLRREREGLEKKRERERQMEERPHVRYSALSSMQDDHRDRPLKDRRGTTSTSSAHEDLRYRFELHEDVPWKSIALALFLLAFGSLFLVISHFIYTEHMGGDSSQAYGFLVLGVLLFLPGFYETRIAYYSWRGYKGYSYSRIPAY